MANIMHGYLEPVGHPRCDEPVEGRARDANYGRQPSQNGYGADLPCGYQVRWLNRWRNCYTMCYGNGSGTPYIKTNKGPNGRLYISGLD